jgi:hypothetical protein
MQLLKHTTQGSKMLNATAYNIVKQNANTFAVTDEVGYVIEKFSNSKLAKEFVKDLQDCDTHALYVRNTDWMCNDSVADEADTDVTVDATVQAVEVKAVKAVKVKLAANANGVRKSDKVRARIALAKQQNETQAVVIEWVIAELQMAKQLAKVYVKGNWDKV